MWVSILALAAMMPVQTKPVSASGQLAILDPKGQAVGLCPLERTSVKAHVSGYGGDVSVVQTFTNPSRTPIEAVYTFPLPADAAVNRMRIRIGTRIVEGEIMKREEALATYNAAKAAGQTAALLDQERPNIFTQSVANIMPGSKIEVEISYVQLLKFEDGQFEFSFPMTVGPRNLSQATDPQKIDPPRGTRVGTNIDLEVDVDAGCPIQNVYSVQHPIKTERSANGFKAVLERKDELPNRDFILRYTVATDTIQPAFVSHMDSRGGYFCLVLLPPKAPTASQTAPREVIFVMDQSGSQHGFPIEKSRELTMKMIKTLRTGDTFNVMGFNTTIKTLFDKPKYINPETQKMANDFVASLEANGGTNILEGTRYSLKDQDDPERLRMVLFNTDGYVGNEAEILKSIQDGRGKAHMFLFGIGSSVNRYLIDAMATEGQGAAEYVTLREEADAAVARFQRRTATPVLTDVSVEADGPGVRVSDLQPLLAQDVFAGQPVVIYGRYTGSGPGEIRLKGTLGTQAWSETIPVVFSNSADAPAIPSLWARKRIEEIGRTDYLRQVGVQALRGVSNTEQLITETALAYHLMSQYTSFVAVEKRVVNVGGRQRTVAVPVEQAEGVFGDHDSRSDSAYRFGRSANGPSFAGTGAVSGGGFGGGGFGQGQGGGGSGRPGAPGGKTGATTGSTGATGSTGTTGATGTGGFPATAGEDKSGRAISPISQRLAQKAATAKGKLEIQIRVTKMENKVLDALKKAGFSLEAQDSGLKTLFGTIDAKKLKDLEKIAGVVFIDSI